MRLNALYFYNTTLSQQVQSIISVQRYHLEQLHRYRDLTEFCKRCSKWEFNIPVRIFVHQLCHLA